MEFILRSGRAMICAIHPGTFNRCHPPTTSELEQKERDLPPAPRPLNRFRQLPPP